MQSCHGHKNNYLRLRSDVEDAEKCKKLCEATNVDHYGCCFFAENTFKAEIFALGIQQKHYWQIKILLSDKRQMIT